MSMELNELIQSGWARHENDTAALAADLEAHAVQVTDAEQAQPFVMLASHAIGEHLRDWPRAAALVRRVVEPLPREAPASGPLAALAVSEYMAGRVTEAAALELEAARLADGGPVSSFIRSRTLIASALIGSGRLDEGARLFEAVLELAAAQGDQKLPSDRAIAITANNLASSLLDRPQRTEAETAFMLRAAEASHIYWMKAGNWENEERAEYLLALTNNAAQRPEVALRHAEKGIAVIQANGEEVVDEAFLNLALANACRLLERRPAYDKALARADEIAEGFEREGLKTWFAEERAKVVWAE
jgi:hypothetical protein